MPGCRGATRGCSPGPGAEWQIATDGTVLSRHPSPITHAITPLPGGTVGDTLFLTDQRRFPDAAGLAAQPLAGGLLAKTVAARSGPVHPVAGV